jgi:hypothetical protein
VVQKREILPSQLTDTAKKILELWFSLSKWKFQGGAYRETLVSYTGLLLLLGQWILGGCDVLGACGLEGEDEECEKKEFWWGNIFNNCNMEHWLKVK